MQLQKLCDINKNMHRSALIITDALQKLDDKAKANDTKITGLETSVADG